MSGIDFANPAFEAAIEAAKSGNTVIDNAPPPVVEPIVETPPAPPLDTVVTPPPANYSEYLKTASEGFFENEDKFKEFIPKIRNYDTLETKLREAEAAKVEFKNDESKAWFELLASGDEKALKSYLSEKDKDYKIMSDIDVRREALAKANPNWDAQEVELEIRTTYGDDLEKIDLATINKDSDPDDYKDAVAHNKEVDRNLLLLSRDARDDRHKLIDNQSKIELPKINKADTAAPGPTEAEIAEATAKWVSKVKETLPSLPNIKQTIDNKEVEYVQSDDDKKVLAQKVESFNIFNFAKEREWVDANGVSDPIKIAGDVQKLLDFEKITSAFATQVKTNTTKQVMGKIKNIDGTNRAPQDQAYEDLADAAHAAKEQAGWK